MLPGMSKVSTTLNSTFPRTTTRKLGSILYALFEKYEKLIIRRKKEKEKRTFANTFCYSFYFVLYELKIALSVICSHDKNI